MSPTATSTRTTNATSRSPPPPIAANILGHPSVSRTTAGSSSAALSRARSLRLRATSSSSSGTPPPATVPAFALRHRAMAARHSRRNSPSAKASKAQIIHISRWLTTAQSPSSSQAARPQRPATGPASPPTRSASTAKATSPLQLPSLRTPQANATPPPASHPMAKSTPSGVGPMPHRHHSLAESLNDQHTVM